MRIFARNARPYEYFKKIISISDIYVNPDLVAISARNQFTVEETLNLILDKLYDLYDDNYHAITTILEGNGINSKRHGEDREFAALLEQSGLVDVMYTQHANAKLTMHGKMQVENSRKAYKENYNEINKSTEDLNSKVDEIIERLTKLGYGQEILFDELEELKELYKTMNKKHWGQILKGKLIDLALAKLVEKETLDFIYKTLTDHHLLLP